MTTGAPTGTEAELRRELKATQTRLAEAEATLNAIRAGRVDALVVEENEAEDHVEIRTILDMGSLGDSLFNQVTQPIFILDHENRIVRSNRPAQDLCGRNPANLLFREALELQPADGGHVEEGMDVLGDWVAERRRIESLDVFLNSPREGSRFFALDANPVRLSWEAGAGGIVTMMDITARKLSEIQLSVKSAQLRHQFNQLKAVSDNIAEGLILLDEERKIIFQNPAVRQLLGIPETDALGRDLDEVFRLEPETGKLPIIGQGAAKDPGNEAEPVVKSGKLMRLNGGSTPVQFSYYPIKDGDQARGSVMVVSDISDRLAQERQLRLSLEKQQQSQKMEAIGRLAGGIAHDFNNLLLAILGFTDLTLIQVEPGSPVHENMVEVRKAGEKAAALTSQLLAYSRKQMLAPRPGSVNGAITDLQKMIERLIGAKIRFRLELSGDDPWSEIDQPKLQQVLINMVLNAKDAMPDGGELTITTGRLNVRAHDTSGMVGEILRDAEEGLPPGSYAVIGIKDTGHGMDAMVMERLFEPFFTTKEFGKGSGLGLSTAYGIIRQLGGYVQVFSEPGSGSHFKVVLPLLQQPPPASARIRTEPPSVSRGDGRLILLVEDEEMVRQLLSKVLVDHGYRVLEAHNGEDALAKLGRVTEPLALIVTDLVMDGMGGVELAEHLALSHPDVEILFMSGYAQDQHIPPKADRKIRHFAAKPFRPVEFLAKIQSLLKPSAQSASAE
jgi:two-component system, cell cycle sensor histidine kinase and response regulator CckA